MEQFLVLLWLMRQLAFPDSVSLFRRQWGHQTGTRALISVEATRFSKQVGQKKNKQRGVGRVPPAPSTPMTTMMTTMMAACGFTTCLFPVCNLPALIPPLLIQVLLLEFHTAHPCFECLTHGLQGPCSCTYTDLYPCKKFHKDWLFQFWIVSQGRWISHSEHTTSVFSQGIQQVQLFSVKAERPNHPST